jgi:hypothetical protein
MHTYREDPRNQGENMFKIITTVLVLTALVAGCSSSTPPLQEAHETCAPESETSDAVTSYDRYVTLNDDGHGLSIDTGGDESDGASIIDLVCLLAAVEAPSSVISRIDSTRALDGTQEAEWDGLRAWWTYHPDNGLDLIIEDEG